MSSSSESAQKSSGPWSTICGSSDKSKEAEATSANTSAAAETNLTSSAKLSSEVTSGSPPTPGLLAWQSISNGGQDSGGSGSPSTTSPPHHTEEVVTTWSTIGNSVTTVSSAGDSSATAAGVVEETVVEEAVETVVSAAPSEDVVTCPVEMNTAEGVEAEKEDTSEASAAVSEAPVSATSSASTDGLVPPPSHAVECDSAAGLERLSGGSSEQPSSSPSQSSPSSQTSASQVSSASPTSSSSHSPSGKVSSPSILPSQSSDLSTSLSRTHGDDGDDDDTGEPDSKRCRLSDASDEPSSLPTPSLSAHPSPATQHATEPQVDSTDETCQMRIWGTPPDSDSGVAGADCGEKMSTSDVDTSDSAISEHGDADVSSGDATSACDMDATNGDSSVSCSDTGDYQEQSSEPDDGGDTKTAAESAGSPPSHRSSSDSTGFDVCSDSSAGGKGVEEEGSEMSKSAEGEECVSSGGGGEEQAMEQT